MRTNRREETSSLKHYLRIVLLSIALLAMSFGCVHGPRVKNSSPPKFTEAELGKVAIISACFEPEFKCPHKPMTKGKATGVGALAGFLASMEGGANSGNAGGLALGIALSPVFAAGGAIYGAIEGETKKTIRKTEETLDHCLTAFSTQEVFQERIQSSARKNARYTFVESEQCGPNVLDEEIRYGALKEKGIDTVFEISVRKFGLWKEKDAINPPLSLFMTASIRLIRVKDDAVLSRRTFRYESKEKRKFTKWAENAAQPFREELNRCFWSLAESVVTDLFVS